ncbi:MAG: hypothetical protein LBG87_00760, partial [Spirochaetaceae bacterium]|nr:hypothetical protein [Spirochaetaceae bacterium]
MTDHKEYLPHKEAELVDWLDNFSAKVQGNDAKWQIPKTETDKIAALTADFKQKHAKCSSPDRSKILVEEKDIAKAAV